MDEKSLDVFYLYACSSLLNNCLILRKDKMMYLKRIIWCALTVFLLVFWSGNLYAQSDSLKTYVLPSVVVKSTPLVTHLFTSPQQILSKDRLETLNAFQVADAVKFFSGVQIKDYGGIGGLKTVSIRNLGANYTAVAYDGIPVTNYMTGQVDIGRFSLENIETLQLTIGESDNIFLPARLQAMGGSLNMITQLSFAPEGKKFGLRASMKTGSYGLLNPALVLKSKLSDRFTSDVAVEYISSRGDYPYIQTYGYQDRSTVKKKRRNSDVENLKLEANLSGHFNNGGHLAMKAYYSDSDRGIPGPSFYYTDENAGERIQDQNLFAQVHYERPIHQQLDFQANLKVDSYRTDYRNLKFQNSDRYKQEEYYFNSSFLYKASEPFSFSFSTDAIYGTFDSRTVHNKYRFSWLSSLSGKYRTSRLTVTGTLLNQWVLNLWNKAGELTDRHLSPYIGLSLKPFEGRSLRIRAFYKNTYRQPTFGDMYYSDIPQAGLKPENAHQYNLGITVKRLSGTLFPYLAFSMDAYYNRINNKIVIIPRQSQFKPSVENYGTVAGKGIDVNIELHIKISQSVLAEVGGSYTYQRVRDKKENGQERILAYTPEHSGSGYLALHTDWVEVNYNLICSGKRYYMQIEEPAFRLNAYSDHNLSFLKRFVWNKFTVQLSAECLNLFDRQYEVVRSYPMQGRSYRLGFKLTY